MTSGTHPLWPDEQTIPMVNSTTNTIQIINLPLFDLGAGAEEEGGADEEGGANEEGGADEEGRPIPEEEAGATEPPAEEGGAEEGPAEEGAPEEEGVAAALHPMDCTDIVIAVARGNQYRVIDFYTRDRSTPRKDEFYGGRDSITAAIAREENGVTLVKWRKPLMAGTVPYFVSELVT